MIIGPFYAYRRIHFTSENASFLWYLPVILSGRAACRIGHPAPGRGPTRLLCFIHIELRVEILWLCRLHRQESDGGTSGLLTANDKPNSRLAKTPSDLVSDRSDVSLPSDSSFAEPNKRHYCRTMLRPRPRPRPIFKQSMSGPSLSRHQVTTVAMLFALATSIFLFAFICFLPLVLAV